MNITYKDVQEPSSMLPRTSYTLPSARSEISKLPAEMVQRVAVRHSVCRPKSPR